MRRMIAILGILMLGSVGCKHVGGKCDCGPQPGEAGTYAPYKTYPASPGTPIGPGTTLTPINPTPELIGPPKK